MLDKKTFVFLRNSEMCEKREGFEKERKKLRLRFLYQNIRSYLEDCKMKRCTTLIVRLLYKILRLSIFPFPLISMHPVQIKTRNQNYFLVFFVIMTPLIWSCLCFILHKESLEYFIQRMWLTKRCLNALIITILKSYNQIM